MPTLRGPSSGSNYPSRVFPALIDAKESWADDWRYCPELQLESARCSTAGHDLDICTFSRRYGYLKQPWENTASLKEALPFNAGWWIRVRLMNQSGAQVGWIGRISGESRELAGSTAWGPSGKQTYVAYGPLQILRRIQVSQSVWLEGTEEEPEEKVIGWVPGINDANDGRTTNRGNRSADKGPDSDCYLYGGTELWTHKDYVEYLLALFCDESDIDGPAWSLDGQADILDDLTETVKLRETQSVDDILRQLIPTRLGVDYVVVPTDDGFAVQVFALSAQSYGFDGEELPRNPNTVQVRVGENLNNITTRIAQTEDHGYKRVRVLGKRMVVCCTLTGAEIVGTDFLTPGSLRKVWSDDNEAEYRNGAGDDVESAKRHDEARQADWLKPVYQDFKASDTWDYQDGAAAPRLDDQGELMDEPAPYQTKIRRTLNWLPLEEGYDYTEDPPVDLLDDDTLLREVRVPMVFVGYTDYHDAEPDDYDSFLVAEELGISVSVPQNRLGVCLSSKPAHLLAKSHWTDAKPTETQPAYNGSKLVATIAFESDQRLRFQLSLPGFTQSEGTLDLIVDDAECWYLAPNTVVRLNKEGELESSGDEPRFVRDDTGRLKFVMAGAIARYSNARCRAEIVGRGFYPWVGLLGQILTTVADGGSAQWMEAPITSVEWHAGGKNSPTTTLHAGFAG